MRILSLLFLTLICATAQAGDVYKWTDAGGKVHYGDRPNHDAEPVDVHPGSGTGTPAEAAAAASAQAAVCADKKKQLEHYKKATAIKETDGLGRTREYSVEERQALLSKTEGEASTACAQAAALAPPAKP
jgi:hypothetical protein